MVEELPAEEVHTRIIKGLDGVDYLIAMEGWYWNSLDWMHANTDWKDSDFIEMGWSVARQMENDGTMKNPGNFPAEFAFGFKACIWSRMVNFISAENGAANNSH